MLLLERHYPAEYAVYVIARVTILLMEWSQASIAAKLRFIMAAYPVE